MMPGCVQCVQCVQCGLCGLCNRANRVLQGWFARFAVLPGCTVLSKRMTSLAVIVLLGGVAPNAFADWSSWWRTPEQQAAAAYESGDIDQLKSVAPDDAWNGVAAHESGDYENAARLFDEESERQRLAGDLDAANRTLYNRGVSEVRAGQYEKAVSTFDQVLEQAPEFTDAKHNREIAQQLIQQQAQEQQQHAGDNQEESSDQGEQSGDQSDSSDSGEQQSDAQSSEQSSQDEQSEQDSAGADGQQDEAGDDARAEPEASQEQAQQDARDALEAEAQSGGETGSDENENEDDSGLVQTEQPMSESEQATEQWLRRIPDDPAGLLRRKLEQSHRTEYPEVRDAPEPW